MYAGCKSPEVYEVSMPQHIIAIYIYGPINFDGQFIIMYTIIAKILDRMYCYNDIVFSGYSRIDHISMYGRVTAIMYRVRL